MKMKWIIETADGNEYRIFNKEDHVAIFSGTDSHAEWVADVHLRHNETGPESWWETPNKVTTYAMITAVEAAIVDFENFDSLNLGGIEIIEIVGERPKTLPEGWVVFNAARPLAGSLIHVDSDRALASGMVPNVWTGTFISGRFYAAVDPADDDAQRLIDQNRNLDARILRWVPVEAHRERVEEWSERVFKNRDALRGIAFDNIDEMFRNHMDGRIIGPVNIYDG